MIVERDDDAAPKQLWERAVTRRIRPFADLGKILDEVQLRLHDDAEPTDQPSIKAEDVDVDRLSPTVLLPLNLSTEHLEAAAIEPNDVELVVLVEDRGIKNVSRVSQYPWSQIPPEIPLGVAVRQAASWRKDTWLHVALILAAQRERRPGEPWRKATWLAKKSFEVVEPPQTFAYDIKPVPGSQFEELGLPADTTFLVQLYSSDLDQPIDQLPQIMEVFLHEDVHSSLSQNPDSPASKVFMMTVALDVVATVLSVGYQELADDEEPSENSILSVVTDQVVRGVGGSADRIRQMAVEPGVPRLRALIQSQVKLRKEVLSATRRRIA